MRRRLLLAGSLTSATLLAVAAGPGAADAATAWAVSIAPRSAGQSHAGTLTAPTGLTATCSGNQNLSKTPVNLNAAPHAAGYPVSQATSATGTYTVIATGVTATSYPTTPVLAGTYYWKVTATTGTWSSTPSDPHRPARCSCSGRAASPQGDHTVLLGADPPTVPTTGFRADCAAG